MRGSHIATPPGCTGFFTRIGEGRNPETFAIHHDSDSCPIHEPPPVLDQLTAQVERMKADKAAGDDNAVTMGANLLLRRLRKETTLRDHDAVSIARQVCEVSLGLTTMTENDLLRMVDREPEPTEVDDGLQRAMEDDGEANPNRVLIALQVLVGEIASIDTGLPYDERWMLNDAEVLVGTAMRLIENWMNT